jgi:hypothetical protein
MIIALIFKLIMDQFIQVSEGLINHNKKSNLCLEHKIPNHPRYWSNSIVSHFS